MNERVARVSKEITGKSSLVLGINSKFSPVVFRSASVNLESEVSSYRIRIKMFKFLVFVVVAVVSVNAVREIIPISNMNF